MRLLNVPNVGDAQIEKTPISTSHRTIMPLLRAKIRSSTSLGRRSSPAVPARCDRHLIVRGRISRGRSGGGFAIQDAWHGNYFVIVSNGVYSWVPVAEMSAAILAISLTFCSRSAWNWITT